MHNYRHLCNAQQLTKTGNILKRAHDQLTKTLKHTLQESYKYQDQRSFIAIGSQHYGDACIQLP